MTVIKFTLYYQVKSVKNIVYKQENKIGMTDNKLPSFKKYDEHSFFSLTYTYIFKSCGQSKSIFSPTLEL